MNSLKSLGWNSFFEENSKSFKEKGLSFARVITEHKERYIIATEIGDLQAEVTGKLLYSSESAAVLPKVGDWVAVVIYEDEMKAIIHDLLPRKSVFGRKASGKKIQEQVIASNIDILFVVQSLDSNYNLRRLERYLTMAYEGNMEPVIILNKSDLCHDLNEKLQEVKNIFHNINSLAISAQTGFGINFIKELITEGKTCALVGSSGVGKSSIINSILGYNKQKVNDVRISDLKGKHTTTTRDLIILPCGGMIIDTPGMREFQLWNTEDGLESAFTEIEKLSPGCRFNDCSHIHETGCAVLNALQSGELSRERYDSYLKLRKEAEWIKRKTDPDEMKKHEQKWKKIHSQFRKFQKFNRKNR